MYQLIMDTKKALGHKKPSCSDCLCSWGGVGLLRCLFDVYISKITLTPPPFPIAGMGYMGGDTTLLWDISLEYFVYSVDGFRRLRLVPLAVNQRRLIRPSRTQNLQALPRQIWKLVSAALFTPRCWQISLCWRWCDLTYVCQRSWFFERRRISEPSAEAGRGVAWNDKSF